MIAGGTEAAGQPDRFASTLTPGEGRQIVAPLPPRNILPLETVGSPALLRPSGHGLDDVAHRHIDALSG